MNLRSNVQVLKEELYNSFSWPYSEDGPKDTEILGCKLVLTCFACPEQYDVYYDGEEVGYFRLRHGYFTANYKKPGGPIVYEVSTYGDGIFDNAERKPQLKAAVKALLKHYYTTHNIGDTHVNKDTL